MFVYIQSFLIIVLEMLCCKIFFEIFGIKRNENNVWKNHIIIAGLIVSMYLVSMIFRNRFITKQIFVITVTAVFMTWYLKISFRKSLIVALLFQGLLILVDYFALLINVSFFNNIEEVWENYAVQGALVVVLGKVLLLLAVFIIRKFMDKSSLVRMVDTEWLRFIFFPLATICIIAAMIKISGKIEDENYGNIFFVIAYGLAGMNIAVFYLIFDILKREVKSYEDSIYRLKVKNQMNIYHSVSENFDLQKKRTHEYKNQIICIDTLIKKKNYEALEDYVGKISGQLSRELDAICTNNVIVDAILNSKYQEINEKNIVFVFKINDLSNLNISDEDVVIILSNLLNNAIEACEECKGAKVIKLKFVIEDENIIISVKNTYENVVVYENGEIQTTKLLKPDEHGIGIKNIIETITKYRGSYVIKHDEQEFYFSIMIPLTKK